MAKINYSPEHLTSQRIYDHYKEARHKEALEAAATSPRTHLGASGAGKPCTRALWYGFRWSYPNTAGPQFDGRILRLFEHGVVEEDRVIENLRAIGCKVSTTADEYRAAGGTCLARGEGDSKKAQIAFRTFHGHFGGSADGIVHSGLPEAPKTVHVLEVKTHNANSFRKLVREGVHKAKPEHVAQMMTYMHLAKIKRAVYVAINKNDDSIYVERVEYKKSEALALLERVEEAIFSDEPPERISGNADSRDCKWCDHNLVCHGAHLPPRHCRSCAHSTPATGAPEGSHHGLWVCEKKGAHAPVEITPQRQLKGCGWHLYHPGFMGPHMTLDAVDDKNLPPQWISYRTNSGHEVRNIVSPLRPLTYKGGQVRLDAALVERDLERAREGGFSAEALQVMAPRLANATHAEPYIELGSALGLELDPSDPDDPQAAFSILCQALNEEDAD